MNIRDLPYGDTVFERIGDRFEVLIFRDDPFPGDPGSAQNQCVRVVDDVAGGIAIAAEADCLEAQLADERPYLAEHYEAVRAAALRAMALIEE